MGIGGVINRPKGQANSPSPFFICWQFLKVGILWKMREAERQTNIAHSSIKKAITGKLKNAGGFQWEYKKMTIFVSQ